MELPELNKRIKRLIDTYSSGNIADFARSLENISRQRLDRLFKIDTRSNKYPSVHTDITQAILEKYPVNPNWLMTGEGEPLIQEETKEEDSLLSTDVNDRVKYIADTLYNGNVNDMCRAIGVKQATMNEIVAGSLSKPSFEVINAIISNTEVNSTWLITGEGEMLLKDHLIETESQNEKGVPYYEDIQATGGIITSYEDYPETPSFYIDYEHFNDCTAYLPVTGDSMFPQYCSGEIVAIRRIFNFDVILWGEAYLVVTNGNANDLRTIKLIFPHEDQSKIILRACNPDYKGDTVINKEDILFLYIIKGKIKRNQL